jgi:predicted ester cyclase
MVVEESVFTGTHTGALFNLPPSGKFITFPLIIMFPVIGDKFGGERMYFDMNTLLTQMAYDWSILETAPSD